jgi:hypothetical protein
MVISKPHTGTVAGRIAALLAVGSILPGLAIGQQPGAAPATVQRTYLTNMADEDWSFLSNAGLRHDFWDPVKYITLPKEDWYLTLGGEVRISPQGLRVRGDSEQPSTIDNYMLQRYLFGADLHMGKRFRFYGELQSGIINGKIASPRPNDEDLLELHQGFVEYRSPKEGSKHLMVRLGRQELKIGSGRLIAPSQGLNVKRSFDGLSTNFSTGDWMIEGGVARLVRIRPGYFDDPPDSEQEFWGINVAHRKAPWKNSQINFYYLGINRKISIYAQGIGPEDRQTVGGRLFGKWGKLDYNYDLIYQWGHFRGASARAWAVSTDTGVALKLGRFPARLGLTVNSSSGDKDPNDVKLQSFNPLFPGNSYSGMVGLFGPTNITDFTPSFRLPLRKNLIFIFESPTYFRSSVRDGIYAIDLRLLLRGQSNQEKFIGINPSFIAVWQLTHHASVTGAITRFQSGKFLSDTFLRHGFGYYSIGCTYRF